ncbi:MAG: hypothetical protein H6719_14580 [Sandaracinaceae bacterium]|nr:hypothetical protein [Sandaracinaceae bacterium]
MSWETVEALPGATPTGGAFRAGAEPVVAERRGVGPLERARLFWFSDPDHPFARTVEHVVVTPRHVYVQRADGTRERASLEQLHGERLDRGRVIYGVRDGEDLLLPYRDACAVQVRLAAAVRGAEPAEPWRDRQWLWTSVVLAVLAEGLAAGLVQSYSLDDARRHLTIGLYTSETLLGFYAALGASAFGAFLFLWGPSRWRIDAVAVTRTRGVIPWLTFSLSPERVRRAVLGRMYAKPKHGAAYHSGWSVSLELREPARIGTLRRLRQIELQIVFFEHSPSRRAASKVTQYRDARALAARLRSLLSLEEETLDPGAD